MSLRDFLYALLGRINKWDYKEMYTKKRELDITHPSYTKVTVTLNWLLSPTHTHTRIYILLYILLHILYLAEAAYEYNTAIQILTINNPTQTEKKLHTTAKILSPTIISFRDNEAKRRNSIYPQTKFVVTPLALSVVHYGHSAPVRIRDIGVRRLSMPVLC